MVDFLIAAAQGLCIAGMLSGAYFSLRYHGERALARSSDTRFDPVTAHVWSKNK